MGNELRPCAQFMGPCLTVLNPSANSTAKTAPAARLTGIAQPCRREKTASKPALHSTTLANYSTGMLSLVMTAAPVDADLLVREIHADENRDENGRVCGVDQENNA